MPANIGWQGALVIIVVLLLVFGPKRLPEMGRSVGRGIREFKDSLSGDERPGEPERATLEPPATATVVETPAATATESTAPGEPERLSAKPS